MTQKVGIAYLAGLMTALTIHENGMARMAEILCLAPVSAIVKALPEMGGNHFFDVREEHD